MNLNFSFFYQSVAEITSFTSFDDSEKKMIKQNEKDVMSSSLHMIFNLWFEKSDNSRADYARLKEILQISKSFADESLKSFLNDSTYILLRKLNTFKQ